MQPQPPDAPASLSAWVDALQASGRYTFSLGEAAAALGRTTASLDPALRRLRRQCRIASPRRGFSIIVPLEYRAAGSPPATWFVDALMVYLGVPYYVGLLSAAALHGASHQQPQVFQVMTDRPLRPSRMARVRLEFHRRRRLAEVAVTRRKTETGSLAVATAETTALDLVRYPQASGGWDHVATVVAELAESIDAERLALAARSARRTDAQRLGYLLEALGFAALAEPLANHLDATGRVQAVSLASDLPRGEASPHPRWRVVPNLELAPDL